MNKPIKEILTSIILIFLTAIAATAQDIQVLEEESKSLNHFAYSIRNFEKFYTDQPRRIYIRLFECGNYVKPLDNGIDVILYDLYISIKQDASKDSKSSMEYGYYWIKGKFMNPRNYVFDPSSQIISFEHGADEAVNATRLIINTGGIDIE